MTPAKTYCTQVDTPAGSIAVDVVYRIRPWGVDLDEVYFANTQDALPLTHVEYLRIAKEISAHLYRNKP